MDTTNMKSTIRFHNFPTEIIFLIFDYLSSNDIIYTFFFFNQRFNNILLENKRYLNYLELPRTNLNTWKTILSVIGPQIKSLNINSVDISFPLIYFSNLKSLIISSPHGFPDEELKSIFESNQFKNLHSFQIQKIKIIDLQTCDEYNYFTSQDYILKKVFNNKNSLKTFEYSLITSPLAIKDTNSFEINFNLHSLTLILTDFKDIYSLISYTPNLEYLNLQSEPPYQDKISINKIDIKLKKLYLTLDRKQRTNGYRYWYEKIDFDQLTNFIKEFSSSLTCLSLNLIGMEIHTTDFPFNNIKLRQLLERMVKLQQFHLVAAIFNNRFDRDAILSTFNDQFWSDHNWSFGIHHSFFFTLPFQFDSLHDLCGAFKNVKSNNPEILMNNPRIWYSIKTIDFLPLESRYDFNFLKELQIKVPKLTTITLVHTGYPEKLEDFYERKEICLNSITTVYLSRWIVEKGKDWLIFLLPNLKHLILCSEKLPSIESELIPILNNKIQKLDIRIEFASDDFEQLIKTSYVYFSNVEYIYICSTDFFSISENEATIIMEILKNFKNLKTLIIYNHLKTSFNADPWNEFIQYFDMNEIMKTHQKVKIFQRYVLFSKETLET